MLAFVPGGRASTRPSWTFRRHAAVELIHDRELPLERLGAERGVRDTSRVHDAADLRASAVTRAAGGAITLNAVRAAAGLSLLLRPDITLRALNGDHIDHAARTYARILGARHLVEAAIVTRTLTPTALRVGAAVDAIHALSAAVLLDTDHRRLGTINVASAAGFAFAGAGAARSLARSR